MRARPAPPSAAALLSALLAAGALASCAAPQPAPPASMPGVPTAERIARSEASRAGALRFLHARGVAELRWRDAQGAHFDQGDLDLRWADGRGLAASISKFGDRLAWIGSDGAHWWRFELKSTPTRLVFGSLRGGIDRPRSLDALAAAPAFLGLRPLVPLEGARVVLREGLAWVEVSIGGPGGDRAEAGFDPASFAPRALVLRLEDGAEVRAEFGELVAVRTDGVGEGAWPRVPRQVTARRDADGPSLSIAIDGAAADPAAADRPALYDLGELRARLAPETVEEAK